MRVFIAALFAGAILAVTPGPDTSAKQSCGFHQAARAAYSDYGITKTEKRRLQTAIRCQGRTKKVRFHLKRYQHAYQQRFYWRIRYDSISPAMKNTLAALRGCETRGIPYPQNYRWNGHHHGAYQYLGSTWQRAQSWAGIAPSRRTAYAYQAGKRQQDYVTARFFPYHRGEWACKV